MTNEIDIFAEAGDLKKPQTSTGKFELGMLIGRLQMAKAVEKTVNVFSFSQWAYIKQSKVYRELKGQVLPDGSVLSGTWEEFCKLAGSSRVTVEELLLNHEILSSEAAEALESAGVSVRQMRTLRSLPDDEKLALIELVKTGDKEDLIDLVDGLVSKHQKDKAELTAKVDDLEQDLKSTGKRINNMNAEIERAELELTRLKNKQRLTKFEEHTEAVRDECMHLQAGVALNLDSLDKLLTSVFYEDDTPEKRLRIEQVYVAITVAASRAFNLLEVAQDLLASNDIEVPRIQGQHILTPEEAERWMLDSHMLESKHEADKLTRDVRREEAKPKGRGRPAGSKNKAEAE